MRVAMSALETKVPPPVLVVLLAVVVWFMPRHYGSSVVLLCMGVVLIVAGFGINAWPKVMFRRVGTTVSPVKPTLASTLVTNGPYRISRNPMYLGYALALLGWSFCLVQPCGLLAVAFFMAYINRFQILPEERYLSCRFPAQYAAYRSVVRRWV
jgi:protein-S-isoprenylcysteine O-methyltransferase Ste14